MITRNFFVADRGVFITLSNICHGIFFEKKPPKKTSS